MTSEDLTVPEKPSTGENLFASLADKFISRTLSEGVSLVHEGDNSRRFRLHEEIMEIPGIGPGLLRVDYREFRRKEPFESFNQVWFEYVKQEPNAAGEHSPIAAMHINFDESFKNENPYPYDLHLAHRYVEEEYREHRGVGSSLYQHAEAWAQQTANRLQRPITIAQSTDQPKTMDWLEKQGYRPYLEELPRRKEILERDPNDSRFEDFVPEDAHGQIRNPSIKKDGVPIRIWFTKTLTPQ